jgi:hypothetical protein
MDQEQLDYINVVKKLYIHISILKENPKYYADEISIHRAFKRKYINDPIYKQLTNMAISDLKNRISSDKEKSDYINATKILFYELNILNGDPNDFQDEINTYKTYRRFYFIPDEIKRLTDYAISEVNKEIEHQKKQQLIQTVTPEKQQEQQPTKPFDFSSLPSNYVILKQKFLQDKILNYEKQKQIPEISDQDKKNIIEFSKTNFVEDTYKLLVSKNISKERFMDVVRNEKYNMDEINSNMNEIQNLSLKFDLNSLKEIEKLAVYDYLVYILRDRRDNINNVHLVKMIDSEFNNLVKNNSISNSMIETIKKRVDEKYILEGYIFEGKIGIF